MAAKTIIAGTDGSEESLRAVEWAAREAALHGAPLRIVSAPMLPPGMTGWPGAGESEGVSGVVHRAAQLALDAAAERAAQAAPGLAVDTGLLSGSPEKALLDLGAEAAMLVVGSRGAGGFAALVLGSVSRYLATRTTCPVVVAREETMAVHGQVVVGVHDPDRCAAALEFAFAEAALRKARLLAVHAWYVPPPVAGWGERLSPLELAALNPREVPAATASRLDSALAAWREKYPGVQAGWEAVFAHPGRVLVGATARSDLVILGRHVSGSGVGSVVHAVLNHAHGPVAIVPGA